MKTVVLLRRSLAGAGGAERVFEKYRKAFSEDCTVVPVSGDDLKGPGWLRALAYTMRADAALAEHPTSWSISLERGPAAMIYRAGDGVHARYRELSSSTGFTLNPLHWIMPHLEQRSFQSAKVIIANSKMVAEDIRRFYPSMADKIRVVYNGYDPKRFFPSVLSKAELRKELGLPVDGTLFLFAGSGWKRKGVKQAEAITALCQTTHAKLVVIGKGDERTLSGQTIFKGVVPNPEKFYQACDALILPTLYDPFSNVVLEALACGLPVVTTRHNGACEVVREGLTGYIMRHPDKDHKEAAYWLETHIWQDPRAVAETVAFYTAAREVDAIRRLFEQIEKTARPAATL